MANYRQKTIDGRFKRSAFLRMFLDAGHNGCEARVERGTFEDAFDDVMALEQGKPCWQWQGNQFERADEIRAHALGVKI